MKRLILMRHAKSDWSNGDASDHERPLNARGRKNASTIGAWLHSQSLRPDYVLCSDAARTCETLALLDLGDVPTTKTRSLYLAEPDVMISELHLRTEDCVLMVAHNPGSAMVADMLLAKEADHPDFFRFPTCATLVADFDITNWRDLRNGTGRTVHFIVPRDLNE